MSCLITVMLAALTVVVAVGMAVCLYTLGEGASTLLEVVARALEAGTS